MKNLILLLFAIAFLAACKNDKKEITTSGEAVSNDSLTPVSDAMLENAIIYEANIRQYSPEGTFNAFTKDIPELKKLNVKVIWLMPIFPISETKRKATGGEFASEIKDEATRERMLGSYYAVTDFTKVNPEFGTMEDLRKLVDTAHENGMYVILDWVPNHTGWDHVWIKSNPEYYTKNAKGEITDPLNEDGTPVGWADVADLNYDNMELQAEMIEDMKYWITKENIDGFRCDMAGMVPIQFWESAIPKLRAEKPIFMLAEAWEPTLLKDNLFDMAYAWDGHHLKNDIAQGKKNVKDWDIYMTKRDSLYEENDILMNFITNHDENSWNGTVKERLADASEAMLALSYLTPGMPLIYSGQEYDMNHRLLFFEKDTIPKTKKTVWPLLEKLGTLKTTNTALNGGKEAAKYIRLKASKENEVLAFSRNKGDNEVVYIANLSKNPIKFTLNVAGDYKDVISGNTFSLKENQEIEFTPWQYLVLEK